MKGEKEMTNIRLQRMGLEIPQSLTLVSAKKTANPSSFKLIAMAFSIWR
ncbi:hypothetical protein MWH06_07125 [Wolbachia pipientis]|nr:hypothetical protein MWH06_07125 [Wolbachia pipientis]